MCVCVMVKKRAVKKNTNLLNDLDKNISKAMKDMDASINISFSTKIPTQKKAKKKVKKK